MKIIIGVDSQFVHHALKNAGFSTNFPYLRFRDFIEGDNDEVLDMFAPVIRFPAVNNSVSEALEKFDAVSRALAFQGVSVIEAPARQSGGGVKHSDDQRLMIRLCLACTRLRPDFLVLVAADGDYAPLIRGLREEGIRTKLVTDTDSVSPELRAAAYSISDVFNILERIEGPRD